MRSVPFSFTRIFIFVATLAATALPAFAQADAEEADGPATIWFVLLFFLGVGSLIVAQVLRRRAKPAVDPKEYNYQNSNSGSYYSSNGSYDLDRLDADQELEWLRKARRSTTRKAKRAPEPASRPTARVSVAMAEPTELDTKVFQEKMRKMQYSQLPINTFTQLAPAKNYQPLPDGDDPALLNAIEQANDEFEDDEAIREVALRILAAFKARNSVEALAQMALYDLSSNLRSKAVMILAEFDHESVFETILLACADPTREVRAAAARGLFKLSFDRAHAWKRLIEAGDDFRMSHAARAAIEAGIVGKSFDRLIHEDVKIAYEAFALVSLLIKAGETSGIFEAIRNHKDERVKFALLHVLRVQRDTRTLEGLNNLRITSSWPTDIADRIREAINSTEMVAA